MLGYGHKETDELIEELAEVFADVIMQECFESGSGDVVETMEQLDTSDILQIVIDYKKQIDRK